MDNEIKRNGKAPDPMLAEALDNIWDSLNDEQKEKAKACKTWNELTALAAKEGVELPDELLDAVAGGYIYFNLYGNPADDTWQVIRDKDGEVMARFSSWRLEDAEQYARDHGQSVKGISTDCLEHLRSKKGC